MTIPEDKKETATYMCCAIVSKSVPKCKKR
jgi:hypothetical protein